MSYTIKHQKTENVARRGFKSHPVRLLSDSELRPERSKNVARQIHDLGFCRLVGAVCLRAFLDRFSYGKNNRHRSEAVHSETLEELERFIQIDAPKWWEAVGFKYLSGDWLLRHCRGKAHVLSMRWHQLKGGLV